MFSLTHLPVDDHPNEVTLRQFLKGDLLDASALQVEEHVASCARCRSRLDQIIGEGDPADTSLLALSQAFTRSGLPSPDPALAPQKQSYPDFETIAAYVDGTLTQEQTYEFEALMKQLPRLSQEVAELRASGEELSPAPALNRAGVAPQETPEKAPPMIVKPATETPTSPKTWWQTWRWPIQSLGLATAGLLFAVVVVNKSRPHTLPIQPGQPQPTPLPVSPTAPSSPDGKTTRGGDGDARGGDKGLTPTQKQLLALSNSRKESQALLRQVKMVSYKMRGSFDTKDVWHSAPAPNARRPLAPSQRLEFRVGEGVQFRFENQANRTLYLALLWMGRDGSITPITRPKPNDSPVLRLTPRGTQGAQISTANYGISPPIGVEKLELFVSTRPVNPATFGFADARQSSSKATGPLSPLDAAIRRAVGIGSASKPLTARNDGTWAASTREITIREK